MPQSTGPRIGRRYGSVAEPLRTFHPESRLSFRNLRLGRATRQGKWLNGQFLDQPHSPEYGRRICVSAWNDYGCLVCRDLIDLQEAQLDLADADAARRDREAIYGVDRAHWGGQGPQLYQ